MQDLYHINLEEFSLDRFRHTLETREMLPARQILKENIPENFAILESMGIHNLQELIDALNSKARIERFARESGLPKEYLVILGREARSYIPKVVYLREIPGVHADHAERLAAVGIKHSKHLFQRGRTVQDRRRLAELTHVPDDVLLELVRLSDLARVLGLGPVFVRLFYEAGVDSLETLSRWTPEALSAHLHAVNQEKGISKVVPSYKDITLYIEAAGELPKVIEYV
jgi:hypothetical protein